MESVLEITIGNKKVEKIFGFDKIGGDIKLAQEILVQRTNEFLAHFDIQIQEFPRMKPVKEEQGIYSYDDGDHLDGQPSHFYLFLSIAGLFF